MEKDLDVKEIRKRLGLTIQQLSERIGVTTGTVWRWEKGTTKPSPLARKSINILLEENQKEE